MQRCDKPVANSSSFYNQNLILDAHNCINKITIDLSVSKIKRILPYLDVFNGRHDSVPSTQYY